MKLTEPADMQGPILLFLARLSAALTRAMVEARKQINSGWCDAKTQGMVAN